MKNTKEVFEEGDCVMLKSGGPKMTIYCLGKRYDTSKDIAAFCQWFDGTKLKSDCFELHVLTKTN